MALRGPAKAWQTRKGRAARAKGFKTEKEAKTFAKKNLRQNRGYRTLSFESKTGHEGTGIVDIVAVRRQRGNRDRLEIVLVQAKGGVTRLKEGELKRLREAAKSLRVSYTVARKRGSTVNFEPDPFESV